MLIILLLVIGGLIEIYLVIITLKKQVVFKFKNSK